MIRIVKMTFQPGTEAQFLSIFESRRERIAGFPGCTGVKLLRSGSVFFTYSHWQGEADLARYRASELFQETWALVKPLFAQKAEAWSVEEVE
ncbi:MAG: antibiotic biosynthesis monooxygenase family protein [Chitinophagales bacterium]